jgi:hypothetical protein
VAREARSAAKATGMEKATRGRPTTRTIDRRWGWDKLLAKASGRPPAQVREAEFRERRRQLLLKLRAARDELGRWPASREWDRAGGDHMSSRGYARTFGSWEAARRAAARLGPNTGSRSSPRRGHPSELIPLLLAQSRFRS